MSVTVDDLREQLESMLATTSDEKLYPVQPVKDRYRDVQGSAVLERIFDAYGLTFSKTKHGPRLASHLSNQTGLDELVSTLEHFFSES
jgi:hypothetical protein